MIVFIKKVLDFSEVWALLIPLIILFFNKQQPRYLYPVISYVILSLLLNILITIGYVLQEHAPWWLFPNNYLYNIQSIIRFICFSGFFVALNQPPQLRLKKGITIAAILLVVINFLFFEDFFERDSFSSLLLATESALLLFYSLQYFLNKMNQDIITKRTPDYWVVTGLSVYVVFNFAFFLAYSTLVKHNYIEFVINMWYFHNIVFVVLCVFLSKAFHAARN